MSKRLYGVGLDGASVQKLAVRAYSRLNWATRLAWKAAWPARVPGPPAFASAVLAW